MFSFWPLFIAFVISTTGHIVADKLQSFSAVTKWVFIVSLVAGLYLLAGGANMAIGWEDPIGATDTSPYVHTAKAWFVIQLVRVWPFFLMAMGGLAVFISYKSLRYPLARR